MQNCQKQDAREDNKLKQKQKKNRNAGTQQLNSEL